MALSAATIQLLLKTAGVSSSILEQLPSWALNASPGLVGSVSTINGNQTVTVPTLPGGATLSGVLLVAPANSTIPKTLKGASGDTGLNTGSAWPFLLLPLSSSTVSFVLSATGAESLDAYWF